MTDLANLVLAVDSTSVPKGTAALNDLTAAGTRAEAATVGLGRGSKTAAAEGAAMAVAAQASARAAMDQAAGFKVATDAARVNTVAMRETLVVARELSRGNFTRIPGSLTLLAQGIGSQGGFGAFLSAISQQLGLVKTLQNAELAEQATAAASAAAAVQNAAQRAAANVIAADTEIALAEAQVRVTAGTSAEGAAQVRLAEAHGAVAAAAAEAAVAEDALAVAMGRSSEASAAAAAASRTVIGTTGALIGVFATVGVVAFAAIKQFQAQVRDDGDLTHFRDSLGLTHQEMLKLSDGVETVNGHIKKLGDVTVSFGDVMHGVWQELSREVGATSAWDKAKSAASEATTGITRAWLFVAENITASMMYAEDRVIAAWKAFPAAFGDIFVQGVNLAIGALNNLVKHGTDLLNGFIHAANNIPGVKVGDVSAPQIGLLNNPNAGAAAKGISGAPLPSYAQELARARAQDATAFRNIGNDAKQRVRDRLQDEADALKGDRRSGNPRAGSAKQNPADEELNKLDAQIASQNALAKAYLISDAAALKAEADEKAMVLAVEKHATAAQTAALKQKELALSIATVSAAGAKEINNLTFEASARQKVNGMVAAGLIPASQANIYMQLETQLRPLIAAQAKAEGEAKRILTDEINRLTNAYADNQAQINIGQAQSQIAANDNEIAQLKLKNDLLGHSNEEIAVALANLQTMQYLADHPGIDASTAAGLARTNLQKAQLSVQSPFQQWAATIPQTAQAVNDALQSIEFKGFDGLASAIADVVTGTKSLKGAFKEVAQSIISDIVQMTVKMLIFRALSSVFGSVLGGGGFSITGSNVGGSPGVIYPRASGGPVNSGQMYLVGEHGPEFFRPASSGTIVPNGKMAANNNTPQQIELTIGFGDAPDFAPYVQQVSGLAAAQAVKISTTHTNNTIKALRRPKISG